MALQQRLSAVETSSRQREKELEQRLSESRAGEQRLQEGCKTLQEQLQRLTSEAADLKLKFGAGETRVRALETEMNRIQTARRDAENQLNSLYSAFRNTLGMRGRSPSPLRTGSPGKGEIFPWALQLHLNDCHLAL